MAFLFVTCRKIRFYVFFLLFYSTWICVYCAYFIVTFWICVYCAYFTVTLDSCYLKCDKISTYFVFFALGAFCACFVVLCRKNERFAREVSQKSRPCVSAAFNSLF